MRVFCFCTVVRLARKSSCPHIALKRSIVRERSKEEFDCALCEARNAYASYVNTAALLACQKPAGRLVNDDELAFQTVHQVEELCMKLLAHTLIDIGAHLKSAAAVSRFPGRAARRRRNGRAHAIGSNELPAYPIRLFTNTAHRPCHRTSAISLCPTGHSLEAYVSPLEHVENDAVGRRCDQRR